jgi:hypothetical protein
MTRVASCWIDCLERAMPQLVNVNPTSEHAIFLRLFVTNGGGW